MLGREARSEHKQSLATGTNCLERSPRCQHLLETSCVSFCQRGLFFVPINDGFCWSSLGWGYIDFLSIVRLHVKAINFLYAVQFPAGSQWGMDCSLVFFEEAGNKGDEMTTPFPLGKKDDLVVRMWCSGARVLCYFLGSAVYLLCDLGQVI